MNSRLSLRAHQLPVTSYQPSWTKADSIGCLQGLISTYQPTLVHLQEVPDRTFDLNMPAYTTLSESSPQSRTQTRRHRFIKTAIRTDRVCDIARVHVIDGFALAVEMRSGLVCANVHLAPSQVVPRSD